NQSKAAAASRAYELGERQDLAGVMVEQQVASLGFQLTLNVRNRALTAYRDIMNMSV
ncbi:MAG: flagellar hook-basal body complex protein FliE, partial [Gemmobacter sp.]